MPAQICVPLACTLTIHGHRRAMASGSLRVGSFSWEKPQAEEEGESLLEDGTLQPRPEAPSLPSAPSPASPAVAHTQAVTPFSHRNFSVLHKKIEVCGFQRALALPRYPCPSSPRPGAQSIPSPHSGMALGLKL